MWHEQGKQRHDWFYMLKKMDSHQQIRAWGISKYLPQRSSNKLIIFLSHLLLFLFLRLRFLLLVAPSSPGLVLRALTFMCGIQVCPLEAWGLPSHCPGGCLLQKLLLLSEPEAWHHLLMKAVQLKRYTQMATGTCSLWHSYSCFCHQTKIWYIYLQLEEIWLELSSWHCWLLLLLQLLLLQTPT